MARERSNDGTTQNLAIDRRAAVKGALAAAGALGLGSLVPSAHAQPSAAPAARAGGATIALTRFLSTTAYADLPPLAVEHAKMILASTLSSAAVGVAMDSARRPSASGVAPPHRPVFPPCGTIGTRLAAHSATTRATSPVVAGRTIDRARPR
jgi:hypothetical protein